MENKIKTAEEILNDKCVEKGYVHFEASLFYEENEHRTKDIVLKAMEEYHSQFTPTATDVIKKQCIAKPYKDGLFIITKDCFADGDIIPEELLNRVVEKEVVEWSELKALQSRVVNVSDLEVEKYLRAGIRFLCDEKCDCHAECKKEDEKYKEIFSKLSLQSEKDMGVKTIKQGEKICDCSECGAEIMNGISSQTIKLFNESALYTKLKEKEMDEFAVGFAEWIADNEYFKTTEEWWGKLNNEHSIHNNEPAIISIAATTEQLLTTYKESITVKK